MGAPVARGRGHGVGAARDGRAAGGPGGVDPFVALVPALVAVAAGIVVVRIFPLPVRALARAAAARRGLVPAYALRRLGSESGSGLILAVLMATATIATFCSVVLVDLDRAADAAAWQDVGAPFRVTAVASGATGTKAGIPIALPDDFDPAALPGVEAAAEGSLASASFFPRGARLDLLALDAAAYAAVTAGTPVAIARLPAGLLARAAKGTNADPVPAVVSRGARRGPGGARPREGVPAHRRRRAADAPRRRGPSTTSRRSRTGTGSRSWTSPSCAARRPRTRHAPRSRSFALRTTPRPPSGPRPPRSRRTSWSRHAQRWRRRPAQPR